jgi:hypothetical protein
VSIGPIVGIYPIQFQWLVDRRKSFTSSMAFTKNWHLQQAQQLCTMEELLSVTSRKDLLIARSSFLEDSNDHGSNGTARSK